jgi:pSer/pThr/pTyr-binding forkhead associated (FHA) protein
MAVPVTLAFTNSSLKGGVLDLARPGKYILGRSSRCDIQLPTTLEFMDVSRHHCVVAVTPLGLRVRDLGSRNGTFINGKHIGQRQANDFPGATGESGWHALEEGDELRLGSTALRVERFGLTVGLRQAEAPAQASGPVS